MLRLVFGAAAVLAVSASARGDGADRVEFAGPAEFRSLGAALVQAFAATGPGVQLTVVEGSGLDSGIESVTSGKAALGLAFEPLSTQTLKKYPGLVSRPIAHSPIVVAVHAGIHVRRLETQQFCDIYAGKIVNWKEVGGPDVAIALQTTFGPPLRSLREALPCLKGLNPSDSANFNASVEEVSQSVRSTVGAAGFLPWTEAKAQGFATVSIGVRGPPESTDCAEGPCMSVLLVYREPLGGVAKAFADFLSTPPAQSALRDVGYVPAPVAPESAPPPLSVAPLNPPTVSGAVQPSHTWGVTGPPAGNFFVRRARVNVTGELASRMFTYALTFELTTAKPLRDAFGSVNLLRQSLRVGQFKTPFGWENPLSFTKLPLIERSLLSRPLALGVTLRDIGISLSGTVPLSEALTLEHSTAIVNGAGENNPENTPKKDFYGRYGVRLAKSLHVALSVASVQTAPVATEQGQLRVGIDAGLDTDSVLVVAEAIGARIARLTGLPEVWTYGFYVLALAKLPRRFEFVVRFEYYEPDTAVSNNEQQRVIVGLNYFPAQPVKVSVNYRFDMAGAKSLFLAQAQFKF